MDNKEKENKIQLNALLKAYSVKEITSLFSQIDKQIISLHECSADDFLQLNNSFKNIYKQSNIISKNVAEILKAFNINKNNNVSQGVNTIYEKLNAQFEIIDYKVLVLIDQFEKLSNQIRHIFFPIKNFRQSLISINYLIANIKVSLSNKKRKENLEKLFLESVKFIDEIKLITDNLLNSLNTLSKGAKESLTTLREIRENQNIDFEKFLTEIQSTIALVDNKNKENKKIIPLIKENIEELNLSNAEIIKKLQYQDIIKQKMEHIQKSHNDLIKELIEFNEPNKENNQLNKKVKCFMRIRDVSGLQAAQLLHANKEYQSAIEVITNNFIKIGDNINDAVDKCKKVYMYGKVNYINIFQKIDSYLNKTNIYIEEYNKQSNTVEQEINNIYLKYTKSENIITNFKDKVDQATNILQKAGKEVTKISKNEPELQDADVQFVSLLNEIDSNFKKLNKLFESLFPFKKNIEGFALKTDNELLEFVDFSEYKKNIKSINLSAKDINQKIDKNDSIIKKIIKNIKTSIAEIQYYDYFEKTIQKIISELNTINFKLKNTDKNNSITKEENLRNLKQYYTMHAEYYIHDKVAQGNAIDIDFDINEDDEIEFF